MSMRTVETELALPSGNQKLKVHFDPEAASERDAEALAHALRRMSLEGSRFLPGQTIAWGANVLRIVALPDGALGLEELDYSGIPGQLQPGATLAIAYLRLQRDVAESVGLVEQMEFPSLNLLARVCSRFDPARTMAIGRRAPEADDETGLFFECQDDHDHTGDEVRRVALYPLLSKAPTAIPFIALPRDYTAIVEPDASVIIMGDDMLPFVEGSMLDVAEKRGQARQSHSPVMPFLLWLRERLGDVGSCAENFEEVAPLVRSWVYGFYPSRETMEAFEPLLTSEPNPTRLYAACVVLAAEHGEHVYETVDGVLAAWKSTHEEDPKYRAAAQGALDRSRLLWDLVERTRQEGGARAALRDPLIERAFAGVRAKYSPEQLVAFERELGR